MGGQSHAGVPRGCGFGLVSARRRDGVGVGPPGAASSSSRAHSLELGFLPGVRERLSSRATPALPEERRSPHAG